MPALANSARAVARSWTAHQMPAARAGVTAMQTRNASASSFDSPFKGSADSTKIPSFAAYRNKNGEQSTKVFQYFMVGTMGALSALGAKATVQGKPVLHLRQHNGAPNLVELQEVAYWDRSGSNWLFCG
jgi:ubiquinol-cytochrome c reductase iron-sulfur subunit